MSQDDSFHAGQLTGPILVVNEVVMVELTGEEWVEEMCEAAKELLVSLGAEPGLIKEDPLEAIAVVDRRFSGIDFSAFSHDEVMPVASLAMSLLGEVLIVRNGSAWRTDLNAPSSESRFISGGSLKRRVLIGPLILAGFKKGNPRLSEMLREAEIEGGAATAG